MTSASLKFSGNIIGELSQKIPSSLFALNELIKNSYDAFSPSVTIKISQLEKKITISDRGNGMSAADIESLFHISKSTKRYGYEVEKNGIKRITQGSKGLGFLSAFKFGDKVEWVTCQNGIRSKFSVCKSELVSKEDVAGTQIPVTVDSHTEDGTIITIHADNQEIDELLLDLSDNRIAEKIASTIIAESFNIKIEIENQKKIISTDKIVSFKKESEDSQLFYVRYNSKTHNIEFYHKGEEIKSIPFNLSRNDYSVNLELIIFHFQKGKNSKYISPINRRIHDDALYPLLYVNNNLFNNIVIFDPELLRKKSSGDTLPQMIGRINVMCRSEYIEFNSDRTNFVENNLTKSLLKDLETLNKLIQTKGSELKKELRENKKTPTGRAYPSASSNEGKDGTASILVNRKMPIIYYIPSEQINLEEYIFQVKNSLGQDVDKSMVEIMIDGKKLTNRVLPSIEEPCKVNVFLKYKDAITSTVSKEITLSFEKQISNISGIVREKSLFTIQSGSNYSVRMETVSELINAIDRLYLSKFKEEHLSVIACSIRSIFEISSEKAIKIHKQWFNSFDVNKVNTLTKKEMNDRLLTNVIHILILLKKNPPLVTLISKETGITYSTLNNLLDVKTFKTSVKTSHIGAHHSTRYLSKPKIELCADTCGLFSVICDVLVNIDKNATRALSVNKAEESDLDVYLGL
ncbi:ATP-binding protein [Serratia nevei]|uniref:ATP-binding protein n=1 Tax=Serratia nevei TaxID=2703794 RepID=UPI0030167F3D